MLRRLECQVRALEAGATPNRKQSKWRKNQVGIIGIPAEESKSESRGRTAVGGWGAARARWAGWGRKGVEDGLENEGGRQQKKEGEKEEGRKREKKRVHQEVWSRWKDTNQTDEHSSVSSLCVIL